MPLNGSYDPTGVPGCSVLTDVPVYCPSVAPTDPSFPVSAAYPPVSLPTGPTGSTGLSSSAGPSDSMEYPALSIPSTASRSLAPSAELQREIEWSMVPLAVGDTCVSDLPRANAPLAIPVTSYNHVSGALPVYTALPAPPIPSPSRGLFGKIKSSVRNALGRAEKSSGEAVSESVSYYRTPSGTSATPTGYAVHVGASTPSAGPISMGRLPYAGPMNGNGPISNSNGPICNSNGPICNSNGPICNSNGPICNSNGQWWTYY